MDIDYRPSQNIIDLVKKLKGRSSKKLQQEFPELKKRYWGRPFGLSVTVVGVQGVLRMRWLMNTWNTIGKPDDRGGTNFIIE